MKNRILWIDNARGISLLCVIAHHTGIAEIWLTKAYLPVFLTVFFFISGFLFNTPNKYHHISQKALNIFTSLIIPYCIYCCLTSIFNFFIGEYEGFATDIKISLLGIKSWFISALVIIELLGLCILWASKRYGRVINFACPFLFMFIYFVLPDLDHYIWNLKNAMFAGVYFTIGMICRDYNITSHFLRNKVGLSLMMIYICFVSADIHWNLNSGNFNESFKNYTFLIIESFLGVPAFIWLCSKFRRYNKLILFIGSNSLLYYYLQSVTIRNIWSFINHLNIDLPQFVEFVVIMLYTSLLISIPVILINRYFPIFSGKYRINIKDLSINHLAK